jgi:hypothetical protein
LVSALSERHSERKAQTLCSKRSLYSDLLCISDFEKSGFGTAGPFKSTESPLIRTVIEGLATHCGMHIKYVCEIITSMNI